MDEVFIEKTLRKGREAKSKVLKEFYNISEEQLNWKPSSKSWSIAQCLEHLLISDSSYFSDLQKITAGIYKMTFWEKYSPFTAKCGQILKDRLQEKVKKKMKAPRKLTPKSSNITSKFIDIYLKNLDTLLSYISNCGPIDIDKTIITSPTIRIVTYSLRDALQFLIQHEHRHINQANRVKKSDEFPKNQKDATNKR